MSPADYEFLCSFLAASSGLSLGLKKQYLLEARLTPVAHRWGVESVSELVELLRQQRSRQLETDITEAMTTKESYFFRDQMPFEATRTRLLPQLMEAKQKERTLRIWSAGCSTGQEPYSLLILLAENFPELRNWKVELLATDLSQTSLEKARTGIYTQLETQQVGTQRGLPLQYLLKYFTQVDESWQVQENLREQVTWKQCNLLKPFFHLGKFDLIFCRNVLIDFDVPTKQLVLERMARASTADGYLVLGTSETLLGITESFTSSLEFKTTIYQRTTNEIERVKKPLSLTHSSSHRIG